MIREGKEGHFMKKSRYTAEQVAFGLRQVEEGITLSAKSIDRLIRLPQGPWRAAGSGTAPQGCQMAPCQVAKTQGVGG